MASPFFTGPNAPFRNPPVVSGYFEPRVFDITGITNGVTTTVTIAVPYNYSIGNQVRFVIPPTFGAQELNGQTGFVLSLPSEYEIEVDINSSLYSSFIPSPEFGPTPPQIVAIGDVNSGNTTLSSFNNSNIPGLAAVNTSTVLPGSFINTSPQIT